MWHKHSHTLAPLTKLCYTKVYFKWTNVEQNYSMAMNKIVGRYVILSYPNFSEEFIIHTDDRKIHLWGVMLQNRNPIDSY